MKLDVMPRALASERMREAARRRTRGVRLFYKTPSDKMISIRSNANGARHLP